MQRPVPILVITALSGLGILGLAATATSRDLIWPLLQAGMAVAVLATFMALRQRGRRNASEFFDVGTLFLSIAFLYTFIPLANFVWADGVYSHKGDSRMLTLQPSPELVARVGWHYLLFMSAFAAVYWKSQRAFNEPSAPLPKAPHSGFLFWMIALYVACQSAFMFLKVQYGLTADSYLESYRVYQEVPLFLQQSMAWLTGFIRIVEIGILACFFSRYDRYRVVVWIWIAVIAIATFMRLHARTDLMIAVGSSVFLYHVFVRQVRLGRLTVIGLTTILAFQVLGVLRGLGGHVDDLNTRELVNSGSEFENVFGNAIHVLTLGDGGQLLMPRLNWYLSELAILVPQQLLPFAKIDPSIWYVQSFFPRYAAMGGGYAWGAIAQSVVGFGLLEAALRGGLLAVALAALDRFLRRRWARLEYVAIYAWLMATIYLSMRDVTFEFVHGVAYFVAPWLLACNVIDRVTSRDHGVLKHDTIVRAIRRTDTR